MVTSFFIVLQVVFSSLFFKETVLRSIDLKIFLSPAERKANIDLPRLSSSEVDGELRVWKVKCTVISIAADRS